MNNTILKYAFILTFSGNLLAQTQNNKPSTTPNYTPFTLTELESSKLENFQLKAEILQTNIQQATQQYKTSLNEFAESVLKAHGSPSNVRFDPSNFKFVSIPENKPAQPVTTQAKPEVKK